MNKQINHVWTPTFIAKSYESVDIQSIDYVDHVQRVQACWRNAQQKARQLIQALTVWANEKGVYGGPDASHLAGVVQDVCADTDMHVEEGNWSGPFEKESIINFFLKKVAVLPKFTRATQKEKIEERLQAYHDTFI